MCVQLQLFLPAYSTVMAYGIDLLRDLLSSCIFKPIHFDSELPPAWTDELRPDVERQKQWSGRVDHRSPYSFWTDRDPKPKKAGFPEDSPLWLYRTDWELRRVCSRLHEWMAGLSGKCLEMNPMLVTNWKRTSLCFCSRSKSYLKPPPPKKCVYPLCTAISEIILE